MVYKVRMRTLGTKIGFERRQLKFGRKGAIIFLVIWAFLFSIVAVSALNGPVDISTLSALFGAASLVLFAVAEFFHESALSLAVLIRTGAASAAVVAAAFFIVSMYLRSGLLLTVVVVGLLSLVILVVAYLQRRRREQGWL